MITEAGTAFTPPKPSGGTDHQTQTSISPATPKWLCFDISQAQRGKKKSNSSVSENCCSTWEMMVSHLSSITSAVWQAHLFCPECGSIYQNAAVPHWPWTTSKRVSFSVTKYNTPLIKANNQSIFIKSGIYLPVKCLLMRNVELRYIFVTSLTCFYNTTIINLTLHIGLKHDRVAPLQMFQHFLNDDGSTRAGPGALGL